MSPDQQRQMQELQRIFLEENAKINLSAYRMPEQCWVGNILDSVSGIDAVRQLNGPSEGKQEFGIQNKELRIIDVGTGGGFPLLPLAMLLPEIHFTGLDATKKKVDAVGRIVSSLGVGKIDLLVGRAEEMGRDREHREQYAIALSRAVAPLAELLEYMSPFVRAGGRLLCWKSVHIDEELQESVTARMQLKCRLVDRHVYTLPGDWGTRQILVFEKTGLLPDEFPRRIGEAKKHPIGCEKR